MNFINNISSYWDSRKITKLELLYGSITIEDSCIICSDENVFETSVSMRCNHNFHLHCISTWSNISLTCPICRSDISYKKYIISIELDLNQINEIIYNGDYSSQAFLITLGLGSIIKDKEYNSRIVTLLNLENTFNRYLK